jgi:hypothetical protein
LNADSIEPKSATIIPDIAATIAESGGDFTSESIPH